MKRNVSSQEVRPILIGIMSMLDQEERQAKNTVAGSGFGMISTWSFTTETKNLTGFFAELVKNGLKTFIHTKSSWMFSVRVIYKEDK